MAHLCGLPVIQTAQGSSESFHHVQFCQYNEPLFFVNFQVFANDSDVSSNAYVTYSLVPDVNNHSLDFSISPVNGSIVSAKQLDRETIGEYYLTVKAENDAVQTERRFVCYNTAEPPEHTGVYRMKFSRIFCFFATLPMYDL